MREVKDFMGYAHAGNIKELNEMITAGFDVTQKDENGATALIHFMRRWSANNGNLHGWAVSNYREMAKLLISKGVDVNATDKDFDDRDSRKDIFYTANRDGKTALHYAAEIDGSEEIVDELLKVNGININAIDGKGRTPLQGAVYAGGSKVEVVKKLLVAKVELTPPNEETKLHFFASVTDLNAKLFDDELLITDDVNLNERDDKGRTALHYAVMHNQLHAVKALIAKGASVNASDADGKSVLHYAHFANESVVKELLEKRADVKAVDSKDRDTPLHSALKIWPAVNEAFVKALINAGADVNAKNKNGATPVSLAIGHVSLETLKLFITAKNVNAKVVTILYPINDTKKQLIDQKKDTTYFHLAAQKASVEVVEYLISLGANITAPNGRGELPLQSAVQNPNPKVLDTLLATNKFDATAKNAALLAAVKLNNDSRIQNDPDINTKVKALLDAGAEVNTKNEQDVTPLHFAAQYGTGETMVQLIEAGADVNARDKNGKTPLHYLLGFSPSIQIIQHFLEKGADLYSSDSYGITPFDYYYGKDAEVSKFLKSKRTWGGDIKHLLSHTMSNDWFVPAVLATSCVALVVGYCAFAYHVIKNAQIAPQVSYSPNVVNDLLKSMSKATGIGK